MRRDLVGLTLLAALLAAPPSAEAQAPSNLARNRATAQARASAERRAQAVAEELFERLCPGRCELVAVRARMAAPRPTAILEPGFEEDAVGQGYEGRVASLNLEIMVDSTLPGAFRQSLPRMLRLRLANVAAEVEVTTRSLPFPEPQPEPYPNYPAQPLYAPPPSSPPVATPEPAPTPEPVAEEPPPEPVEESLWAQPLLWVALLLALLLLAALALLLRRRGDEDTQAGPQASPDAAAADGEQRRRRLEEEIRMALRDRRAVTNAALARWLAESEAQVARFVGIFGPASVADLRARQELGPALARVGEALLARPSALDAQAERALFEEARARFQAAELTEGRAREDWAFLEGLDPAHLARLLADGTAAERALLLATVDAPARGAALAELPPTLRSRVLLEASVTAPPEDEALERSRGELRRAADTLRRDAAGGRGEIGLAADLLAAVSAQEQVGLVAELRSARPEVAEAVQERVLLERGLRAVPAEVLADAATDVSLDDLLCFLRGTEPETRDRVEAALPERLARMVAPDLAAQREPPLRAAFQRSRVALIGAVMRGLRREGLALADMNGQTASTVGPVGKEAAE